MPSFNRSTSTETSVNRSPKVSRTCVQCGTVFEIHQCRFRTSLGAGKYCGRACSDLGRRTRCIRNCRHCGTEFKVSPSQFKAYKGAGKFCSRKCAYAGMVVSCASKPIKDRYGRSNRKADKEWQAAVREKDGSTCQKCGVYDKHIHTHHVAPRSRRPDLRHVVENGKCLCGSCHLWCHYHPIEATAMGLLSDASYERAKREKTFCVVCGEANFGHGYCLKHYKRWKKYGDPLLTKKHGGGNAGDPFLVSAEVSMR